MTVIPCSSNQELRNRILQFSEVLKEQAHTLGDHGLSEEEFYNSGVFRGAIERIRGQFAATMREKRDFVARILNHMQDEEFILDWESAGEQNRHDYSVELPNGRIAIIELKGCLDGNNTNIFDRPPHAQEFYIWSVCTNPSADPRHNVWSGIHTRLSAEIISRQQVINGVIVWDMVCGTIGRPCPKIERNSERVTSIGPYTLPPPSLYVFPPTIPSPRNNPRPSPANIADCEFLNALSGAFGGKEEEVNYVDIEVAYEGAEIVRKTTVRRNGQIAHESGSSPIRRT